MRAENKLESILEMLCEFDHAEIEQVNDICGLACAVSVLTEKHNALQYTHYYDIEFDSGESLSVEIESGINNGTLVVAYSWDNTRVSFNKEVEVISNIVLDEEYYNNTPRLRRQANIILNSRKKELLDFYRKRAYDKYVTGCNSGLRLEGVLKEIKTVLIYESKVVDRNFI